MLEILVASFWRGEDIFYAKLMEVILVAIQADQANLIIFHKYFLSYQSL